MGGDGDGLNAGCMLLDKKRRKWAILRHFGQKRGHSDIFFSHGQQPSPCEQARKIWGAQGGTECSKANLNNQVAQATNFGKIGNFRTKNEAIWASFWKKKLCKILGGERNGHRKFQQNRKTFFSGKISTDPLPCGTSKEAPCDRVPIASPCHMQKQNHHLRNTSLLEQNKYYIVVLQK